MSTGWVQPVPDPTKGTVLRRATRSMRRRTPCCDSPCLYTNRNQPACLPLLSLIHQSRHMQQKASIRAFSGILRHFAESGSLRASVSPDHPAHPSGTAQCDGWVRVAGRRFAAPCALAPRVRSLCTAMIRMNISTLVPVGRSHPHDGIGAFPCTDIRASPPPSPTHRWVAPTSQRGHPQALRPGHAANHHPNTASGERGPDHARRPTRFTAQNDRRREP